MADILPLLDNVIVECCISDAAGRGFWKRAFPDKTEADWSVFVDAFFKAIGQPLPADPKNDRKYVYLQALLDEKVLDVTKAGKSGVVGIEAFGKFLAWFGPLNKDILVRVSDLCSKPWFYGKISSSESQTILNGKDKYTFLIRMSESQEGCFTISKVEKDKTISNQRVLYNPKDDTFTIAVLGKTLVCKSLPEIVSNSELKLKHSPAEKNNFAMLFEHQPLYVS